MSTIEAALNLDFSLKILFGTDFGLTDLDIMVSVGKLSHNDH